MIFLTLATSVRSLLWPTRIQRRREREREREEESINVVCKTERENSTEGKGDSVSEKGRTLRH